jgi:hypothetical protein
VAAHGWVRTAVTGGIMAGIVGGVVLALVRVTIGVGLFVIISFLTRSWHSTLARIARSEIWAALKVAAYPLVGERVLDPGFDAGIVLLGVATSLISSSCLGVVFGLVAHGRSGRVTVALGILCGIVVSVVNRALINPSVGALIEFIPYGLAMALSFLWYERRFPSR